MAAAYVGDRIPPPAIVASKRLGPDAQWPAYISRRVPPLASIACQGLWPDAEWPAYVSLSGPTTGQRRMAELAARLAAGTRSPSGPHHSPFAHCAELTAGVAIVTAAIGANAITTTGRSRRTNVPMGASPRVLNFGRGPA